MPVRSSGGNSSLHLVGSLCCPSRFDLIFSFQSLLLAAVIAGLLLMVKPVPTALEKEKESC